MARIKTFDPASVIDRAMQLFWRQGYEATSVQELVDALGLDEAVCMILSVISMPCFLPRLTATVRWCSPR